MKVIVDFKKEGKFEKLLAGLVEGNDITNFSVDKDIKRIQILVSEWNLELKNEHFYFG